MTEFLYASIAGNSARKNLQMSQAAENIQEFVSLVTIRISQFQVGIFCRYLCI